MHVKIDVSENVRFIEKDSFLGVATDDGCYKKNVGLRPAVKKRINNYSSKTGQIHSILIYHLIKDEIHKYSSIKICKDASKNEIINTLRRLFKEDNLWKEIEREGRVKVTPVKNSYVDKYIKNVRKGKEESGEILDIEQMKEYLLILDNKTKEK